MLVNNPTGNAAIADGTGVGTINDNDVAPQRRSRSTTSRWPRATAGRPLRVHGLARRGLGGPDHGRFRDRRRHGDDPRGLHGGHRHGDLRPGDTSETVTVQVNGDTAVEPDETFDVEPLQRHRQRDDRRRPAASERSPTTTSLGRASRSTTSPRRRATAGRPTASSRHAQRPAARHGDRRFRDRRRHSDRRRQRLPDRPAGTGDVRPRRNVRAGDRAGQRRHRR